MQRNTAPRNARFMTQAALLSALLAVVAAVSALFSGHYANEAVLEQIQSSNKWSSLFQIAIAMTAISVLTRKRRFLGLSFAGGILGVLWMARSFLFY